MTSFFLRHSTIISTLDCCRSSSLPRAWCPFCLLLEKPEPRSAPGPRGCLRGMFWPPLLEASSKFILNDLLLPIGPPADCDWDCGSPSQENTPRTRLGLSLGTRLPPRESPPSPLTRSPSSRCGPRADPEAVGVRVGVVDAALLGPYSWNLPILDDNATGKLADDGTGEGVYDRKSANDFAARRFCWAPKPPGESGIPRKPEDCCPLSVLYMPGSALLASLKSIVAARFRPRRWASPGCIAETWGIGGLTLLLGGARTTWTWRCSPFPREMWANPIWCESVWTRRRWFGDRLVGKIRASLVRSSLKRSSSE